MSDLDKTVGRKILLPNMKVTDVDSHARPIYITDPSEKIGEIVIMKGDQIIAQFSYNLRLLKIHAPGYKARIVEGGNAAAATENPALILPPGVLG